MKHGLAFILFDSALDRHPHPCYSTVIVFSLHMQEQLEQVISVGVSITCCQHATLVSMPKKSAQVREWLSAFER